MQERRSFVSYVMKIIAMLLVVLIATVGCQESGDAPSTISEGSTSEVVVDLLPVRAKAAVGDTILVSIKVSSSRGLTGADIDLSFESTYLEAIAFGDGDAFGPSPVRGRDYIDNDSGLARLAVAKVGPPELVGSSDSTLATIMFEVVSDPADKETTVSVTTVQLVNSDYNIIPNVMANGMVFSIEE